MHNKRVRQKKNEESKRENERKIHASEANGLKNNFERRKTLHLLYLHTQTHTRANIRGEWMRTRHMWVLLELLIIHPSKHIHLWQWAEAYNFVNSCTYEKNNNIVQHPHRTGVPTLNRTSHWIVHHFLVWFVHLHVRSILEMALPYWCTSIFVSVCERVFFLACIHSLQWLSLGEQKHTHMPSNRYNSLYLCEAF